MTECCFAFHSRNAVYPGQRNDQQLFAGLLLNTRGQSWCVKTSEQQAVLEQTKESPSNPTAALMLLSTE